MLTLYQAPGACSRAIMIALEEAGAEFESVRVDLANFEQRQENYLSLNPKGRVPLLLTPEGGLTENPAILLYIAMQFPQAELAPLDDPFALARVQEFNAYLSSTVHVAHAHGPRGARWATEESSLADLKRQVPRTMTECFELIEHQYFQGPWVMGEDYSICDPYLFTIAGWLEADGVDVAQLPKVMQHRERMSVRPAVQRALARETG